MAADVEISDGKLIVTIKGWDKILALTSKLTIPLTHVEKAELNPDVGKEEGIKVIGATLPGIVDAGMFAHKEGMVFWDVHDTTKAISVYLNHEKYKRLIVEVADPAKTVATIQEAVAAQPKAS